MFLGSGYQVGHVCSQDVNVDAIIGTYMGAFVIFEGIVIGIRSPTPP